MDTVSEVAQREPTSFAASYEQRRPRGRQGSIPDPLALDPDVPSFSGAVLDIEASGRPRSSTDPRPPSRLKLLDEWPRAHSKRVQLGGSGVDAPSSDPESDDPSLSKVAASSQRVNRVQPPALPRPQAKSKHSNLRPRVEPPAPGTGGTQRGGGGAADSDAYPWPDKFEERYPLPNDANSDFDRKYPRDRFGTEVEDNARVWKVYRDRAKEQDDDLFEAWKETLDVLLVFAGLFSAICTAFIIEAHKLLGPDWDEITARATYGLWALQYNVSGPIKPPYNPESFSPANHTKWANWLWFIALSLSLFVALLAILAKQWISQYRSRMRAQVASHRTWVWRHRAFSNGLESYQLDVIISSLPLMLHMALFAFFAGLSNFLLDLSYGLAVAIGVGVACVFVIYIFLSLVLPVLYGDCPMSTPLVDRLQYYIYLLLHHSARLHKLLSRWTWSKSFHLVSGSLNTAPDLAAFHEERLFRNAVPPERDTEALLWMVNHFRNHAALSVALEAVGALPIHDHRDKGDEKRLFSAADLQNLREMVLWRTQTLNSRDQTPARDAELVYMLRTGLFLATIAPEDDENALKHARAITCWADIKTHDGHLLYEALMQPGATMLDTVNDLDRWLSKRQDLPVVSASIALWVTRAAERLLYGRDTNGGATLNLCQLAVLLRCLIASAPAPPEPRDIRHLAHSRGISSSITESTATGLNSTGALYVATRARRIAGLVAQLDPAVYKHWNKRQYAHEETWILDSLGVWGTVLRRVSDGAHPAAAVETFQGLYAMLLTHISARTAPIGPTTNLAASVKTLNYLATDHFTSMAWTSEALLGPLDLLLRLLQYTGAMAGDTAKAGFQIATLLRHLFAYVAARVKPESHAPLVQCMSRIVQVLGKQHAHAIALSPPEDCCNVQHTVRTGQLALLRRPSEDMPSIWDSACDVLPASDNVILLDIAINISRHIRAATRLQPAGADGQPEKDTDTLLRSLLTRDRALDLMLIKPDGQQLARHVQAASRRVSEEAQDRLVQLHPSPPQPVSGPSDVQSLIGSLRGSPPPPPTRPGFVRLISGPVRKVTGTIPSKPSIASLQQRIRITMSGPRPNSPLRSIESPRAASPIGSLRSIRTVDVWPTYDTTDPRHSGVAPSETPTTGRHLDVAELIGDLRRPERLWTFEDNIVEPVGPDGIAAQWQARHNATQRVTAEVRPPESIGQMVVSSWRKRVGSRQVVGVDGAIAV